MLVTLQARGTITVGRELRERLGISPGDPLEASVEGGRLVLTPVHVVPRGAALSASGKRKEMEADLDVKRGRVKTFSSAKELLGDLHARR